MDNDEPSLNDDGVVDDDTTNNDVVARSIISLLDHPRQELPPGQHYSIFTDAFNYFDESRKAKLRQLGAKYTMFTYNSYDTYMLANKFKLAVVEAKNKTFPGPVCNNNDNVTANNTDDVACTPAAQVIYFNPPFWSPRARSIYTTSASNVEIAFSTSSPLISLFFYPLYGVLVTCAVNSNQACIGSGDPVSSQPTSTKYTLGDASITSLDANLLEQQQKTSVVCDDDGYEEFINESLAQYNVGACSCRKQDPVTNHVTVTAAQNKKQNCHETIMKMRTSSNQQKSPPPPQRDESFNNNDNNKDAASRRELQVIKIRACIALEKLKTSLLDVNSSLTAIDSFKILLGYTSLMRVKITPTLYKHCYRQFELYNNFRQIPIEITHNAKKQCYCTAVI